MDCKLIIFFFDIKRNKIMAGVYNTSIRNCVVPHYKKGGGELEALFRNWKLNTVFEGEKSLYDKNGDKMSTAISGLCLADMFTQFGLTQKDEYIKSLFSTISCYKGKDSVISYLVATRPYRIRKSDEYDSGGPNCPDNVVFHKNTLILPRGELIWSLLAIPADRIGVSNNPNNFKIYVDGVVWGPNIRAVENPKDEFKSHADHLGFKKISESPAPSTTRTGRGDQEDSMEGVEETGTSPSGPGTNLIPPQTSKKVYYVTLNPYIYTRIKAYRCIPADGKTLEEQYLMVHKMNLLYTQTLGALALIPVEAKRLLQYPPATRESICVSVKDQLHVLIPKDDVLVPLDDSIFNISSWAMEEEQPVPFGYKLEGRLPQNMIWFPESKSSDECETNRDSFHNFLQTFERSNLARIRDEQRDTDPNINIPMCFDKEQHSFWYRFMKNTYPAELKYRNEIISKYTPNCTLTPLGVVATRTICEGDPLIFVEHTMDIDKLHQLPNSNISNYDCHIEGLDIPTYEKHSESDRVGSGLIPSSSRAQASPLAYTSAFVTSLGTNITILPR